MTVENLACTHASQETIKDPIQCKLLNTNCPEQYEWEGLKKNDFRLPSKPLPENCATAKNNTESEK